MHIQLMFAGEKVTTILPQAKLAWKAKKWMRKAVIWEAENFQDGKKHGDN